MIPLPEKDYDLAASKLKDVRINNLFARSVAEKHISGRIYVDKYPDPKAFYVIHPYGMSLLFGDVRDEFLNRELRNYLLGTGDIRKGAEWLQIYPPTIEAKIDRILEDELFICDGHDVKDEPSYKIIKHKRVNFKFSRQKYDLLRGSINLNSFDFKNIDETIFNSTDGSVIPKRFWDTASDFLSKGVGFSLIKNDRPVASAFSSFCHDLMLEMGMETEPEMRKNGFATIVCTRFIDHCLEKDLEPVWACRMGNGGSYNLAIKLGFEPHAILPYYELRQMES